MATPWFHRLVEVGQIHLLKRPLVDLDVVLEAGSLHAVEGGTWRRP
jgi:hypothetical protein